MLRVKMRRAGAPVALGARGVAERGRPGPGPPQLPERFQTVVGHPDRLFGNRRIAVLNEAISITAQQSTASHPDARRAPFERVGGGQLYELPIVIGIVRERSNDPDTIPSSA